MANYLDEVIGGFDKMLQVVAGVATASRPNPGNPVDGGVMSDAERQHSAALMRVNHVGEVCAQALYNAQGRFSNSDEVRLQFAEAAREEEDHLAWTAQRINELGSRPSLLNPLWYGGAYALGLLAANLGNGRNLGFVVETERQVEAHLKEHLNELPSADLKSRAIVEQMCADELAHGEAAKALGAVEMPAPLQKAMRFAAKIMTTTAYRI